MTDLQLTELRLILLVGESGVGKSTIVQSLLELHPLVYKLLISNTTRPKKPGDLPGEYRYRSPQTIRRWERLGRSLWPPAKVAGNLYASRQDDLARALNDREHIYLSIVVPEVAIKLFELCPRQVLPLWISADKGLLPGRMVKRGDNPEDIARRQAERPRWETALKDREMPYTVIQNNGNPKLATEIVHEIVCYHLSLAA